MLQSAQWNAYKRSVGDTEEIARLKVCNPNEGENLSSSGGDKVRLNWGEIGLGYHIDQVVPSECGGGIAAYQVDCK